MIKNPLAHGIFMIGEAVEGTRWGIEKEAPCSKCQRGTVQLIEIGPANATVTCTHCFAESHYTVHSISLPERPVPFESRGFRGGHEVWDLAYVASCPNCGNCVENEVNVDQHSLRTFCPACYYTRSYEFNMYTEPRSRR